MHGLGVEQRNRRLRSVLRGRGRARRLPSRVRGFASALLPLVLDATGARLRVQGAPVAHPAPSAATRATAAPSTRAATAAALAAAAAALAHALASALCSTHESV